MSVAEKVRGDELFAARASEMRRVVIASVIGTTIEWYDFLIYATASALIFTELFFPSQDAGRRHVDFARNQSEIATFARPKHQPMGAHTDRATIAIGRPVTNPKRDQ